MIDQNDQRIPSSGNGPEPAGKSPTRDTASTGSALVGRSKAGKKFVKEVASGIRKHLVVTVATAVVAMGVLLFKNLRTGVGDRIAQSHVQPGADTLFNVLVADLAGDDAARTETLRLARALAQNAGMDVIMLGRTIQSARLGSLRRADEAAAAEARRWLRRKNGDVLVWGHVAGKTLLLSFVPREGTVSRLNGYGSVGEELELPIAFSEQFEAQVQAVALSLVQPQSREGREVLARRLLPVASKLRGLLRDSATLSADTREALGGTFAFAALIIAGDQNDAEWCGEAAAAIRATLRPRSGHSDLEQWGGIQNSLGFALECRGEANADTVSLQAAIIAYRSSLQTLTTETTHADRLGMRTNLANALTSLAELQRDVARMDSAVAIYRFVVGDPQIVPGTELWLLAQQNLGTALVRRGELRGNPNDVEEGLHAYRRVAPHRSRERSRREWAEAQGNIGNALVTLGTIRGEPSRVREGIAVYRSVREALSPPGSSWEWIPQELNLAAALQTLGNLEADETALHEAVGIFRTALRDSLMRERYPGHWAVTQQRLGGSLERLGSLRNSPEYLRQAAAAHRASLRFFTFARGKDEWALAQTHLAEVLTTLGTMEQDPLRLEQAVQAYHLTLLVYTRESAPLEWARTQNAIGAILLSLGTTRGEPARVEAALQAFRAAQQGFKRSQAPGGWSMSQQNIGGALQALGTMQHDLAQLQQALDVYELALEERPLEREPFRWARTHENIGTTLLAMAELSPDKDAYLEKAIRAYQDAASGYIRAGAQDEAAAARRQADKIGLLRSGPRSASE